MIEKKDFLIPKNVEEGVTLFGNMKAKELVKTLLPSLVVSAGVFYAPLNPFVKIGIAGALILIPGYLIADRPIRKNIPVLYHLKTWIRYELRQKDFMYQKERYHAQISEKNKNQGTEAKADSPKVHPPKSRIGRIIDYDRKQIGQTPENHIKKYGTYE